MLRFPFSIKTKFPSFSHTRVCTCVHAHKRFWSWNSAKQFWFRVYAFCLDLRSTVFMWPLCFNIYSGVCSRSEPSANFHLCCPRCILKFFSPVLSGNQKAIDLCTKDMSFSPFPHPLLLLNTIVFSCFITRQSEQVNVYMAYLEFYFPAWLKTYMLYQNNQLFWICKYLFCSLQFFWYL